MDEPSSRARARKKRIPRVMAPEYLTTGAVIVAAVAVLIGAGLAVLAAYLIVSSIIDGISAWDTVGRARPMPAWWALIGALLAIAAGLSIAGENVSYLYRCARGRVPRLTQKEAARIRERARRR